MESSNFVGVIVLVLVVIMSLFYLNDEKVTHRLKMSRHKMIAVSQMQKKGNDKSLPLFCKGCGKELIITEHPTSTIYNQHTGEVVSKKHFVICPEVRFPLRPLGNHTCQEDEIK